MQRGNAWLAALTTMLIAMSPMAVRLAAASPSRPPALAAGKRVFDSHCAGCHATGVSRAPPLLYLRNLTPQSVYTALEGGTMRTLGAELSPVERKAVAEYVTNRVLAEALQADIRFCQSDAAGFDRSAPPAFTGWGFDLKNSHATAAEAAGLTAADLPRLKLKWAFGLANAGQVRTQPAIAGGAIFVAGHDGNVYALDAKTGCVRWQYQAGAEVRSAIVVSPWSKGDATAAPVAYFGDARARVYAVEAFTGKLLWMVNVDDHPLAVITGAPALYAGTLYVPVSSLEESAAAIPGYACCSFRGSIVALDAHSGSPKWRRWLVTQAPNQARANPKPLAPAGIAVWSTPAIDVKRGQLTIGTGDSYTQPVGELSDSILALDLATGRVRWRYQATAGDAWTEGCMIAAGMGCPKVAGRDFDFGAGTVLTHGANGRELLIAGQKSGFAYALDPDTGKLVWRTRIARGGDAGGIMFGIAAANGYGYFPVSDVPDGHVTGFPDSPGLDAVDLAKGEIAWRAAAPDDCLGNKRCQRSYSGAVSVAGGLVLVGGDDAFLRIYDAATGKMLWDYNTNQAFPTVNGVAGHGGAISGGAAPVAWGGQLIVASGYGHMPGNVLLVFSVE